MIGICQEQGQSRTVPAKLYLQPHCIDRCHFETWLGICPDTVPSEPWDYGSDELMDVVISDRTVLLDKNVNIGPIFIIINNILIIL